MRVDGVIHDNVVHQKKPIVVNGQRTWLKPAFAKTVIHALPGGKRLSVQAGTQIIDRYWRNLRSHLEGHTGKVGSESLRRRVRSSQWTYWRRGSDLWAETGELIRWHYSR